MQGRNSFGIKNRLPLTYQLFVCAALVIALVILSSCVPESRYNPQRRDARDVITIPMGSDAEEEESARKGSPAGDAYLPWSPQNSGAKDVTVDEKK